MSEATFDPNVFLSMPSEIGITKAAAMQLDRAAIEANVLARTLVLAIWGARITVLREQFEDILPHWSDLDGGSYSLIFEDGVGTIDMITADNRRVALICTEVECEEAQLDIEDYFNHCGAKITRIY